MEPQTKSTQDLLDELINVEKQMNELNQKIQHNNQKISEVKYQNLSNSPKITSSSSTSPYSGTSLPKTEPTSTAGLFRKYYEQQQLLKLEREVLERKAQEEMRKKGFFNGNSSNDLYYAPSQDDDDGSAQKNTDINLLSQMQPYGRQDFDNIPTSSGNLYPDLPPEEKKGSNVLDEICDESQKYNAEEDLRGKTVLEVGKDLMNQVKQFFKGNMEDY